MKSKSHQEKFDKLDEIIGYFDPNSDLGGNFPGALLSKFYSTFDKMKEIGKVESTIFDGIILELNSTANDVYSRFSSDKEISPPYLELIDILIKKLK